jgi:hypothetical protein
LWWIKTLKPVSISGPAACFTGRGFAMAEINKLSVGQALDKLRGNLPESKSAQRDKKIEAFEEDIQRMSATRRRLERDQQNAKPSDHNAVEKNVKQRSFSIPRWVVVLAVIGPVLLAVVIFYAALVR